MPLLGSTQRELAAEIKLISKTIKDITNALEISNAEQLTRDISYITNHSRILVGKLQEYQERFLK